MSIRSSWLDKASMSAAILGMIAAIVSAVITFTAEKFTKIDIAGIELETKHPSTLVLEDTRVLKAELENIKSQIDSLTRAC